MKKFFKLFLLTIVVVMFALVNEVKADEIKEKLNIKNYVISKEPVPFPNASNEGQRIAFHVKKTSDGKYVYCIQYAKRPPVTSITYNKDIRIVDAGMNYILYKGYHASNDQEFFIYQTALWVYMVEEKLMTGTHNDIIAFRDNIYNNNSAVSEEIKRVIADAKAVKRSGVDEASMEGVIKIDDSNVTFTLKDGYYVSSKINIESSTNKSEIKITNAPEGTVYDKTEYHNGVDGYIVIRVPADKVTEATKIEFEASNNKSVYYSYFYKPSDNSYQTMAATFKQKPVVTDKGSVTVKPVVEKKDVITKIYKVDVDTKEILAGAELQLIDSNGKIVETWTTGDTYKEFKNLVQGTYTLIEVGAPEGYEKSDKKIVFKIDAKGNLTSEDGKKIDNIVFENKKKTEEEKITGVKISKQDITNEKELSGATLIIKDYDGNIIKEFVSGNEPTFFELKPGIYTLTEKYAPEGYALSDKTITFTVKDDGTIETVVMFNEPNSKEEVKVDNSASFKSIVSVVIGLISSMIGGLLIFKKPKHLV